MEPVELPGSQPCAKQQPRIRRKPVAPASIPPNPKLDSIQQGVAVTQTHSLQLHPPAQPASGGFTQTANFNTTNVYPYGPYFPPPQFRGSNWARYLPTQANANVLNYVYTTNHARQSHLQGLYQPESGWDWLNTNSSPTYQASGHGSPSIYAQSTYSDSIYQFHSPDSVGSYDKHMTSSYFPPQYFTPTQTTAFYPGPHPPSFFDADTVNHSPSVPPLSPSTTISSSGTGHSRRSSRQLFTPSISSMVGGIKSSTTRGLSATNRGFNATTRGLSTLPLAKMKPPKNMKPSRSTMKLMWTGARWVIRISALSLGADLDIGDFDFGGGGDVEIDTGDMGGGDDFAPEDGDAGGDAGAGDPGAGDAAGMAFYEEGAGGDDPGAEGPPTEPPPVVQEPPQVPVSPTVGLDQQQMFTMNMSAAFWSPLQSGTAMPAIQ